MPAISSDKHVVWRADTLIYSPSWYLVRVHNFAKIFPRFAQTNIIGCCAAFFPSPPIQKHLPTTLCVCVCVCVCVCAHQLLCLAIHGYTGTDNATDFKLRLLQR